MKALKIASLTALAAAISAQAAADFYITKGADITVSGKITTQATFDLDAEDKRFVKNLNDDGQVKANLAISNGVFAANLGATYSTGADNAVVKLSDVVVTDGNLSFGQVGSVVNTNAYTPEQDNDTNKGMDYGVDAAIRVTDLVPGLKVQLEGTDTTYGIGAGFEQAVADGVTVHAAAQYQIEGAEDPFVGAGVTAAVAGATVKASVQSNGVIDYGVSADYAIAGATVGASYGAHDEADATYTAYAGYALTQDALSVSAKATYKSDESIKVDLDASYTAGAVKYFTEVDATVPGEGDATTDVVAGATYTRVASYTGKFVSKANGDNNSVVVEAAYSF